MEPPAPVHPIELRYDASCPVCRSYAALLKKSVPTHRLRLVALKREDANQLGEFALQGTDGVIRQGKEAIEYLTLQVPEVKECLWILPPAYRGKALYPAYRIGTWIRRWLGRRDCNC